LGAKLSLWDPLLEAKELDRIESEGIGLYRMAPSEVQFAFLCVPHIEILEFLQTYNGPLFDYKKIVY